MLVRPDLDDKIEKNLAELTLLKLQNSNEKKLNLDAEMQSLAVWDNWSYKSYYNIANMVFDRINETSVESVTLTYEMPGLYNGEPITDTKENELLNNFFYKLFNTLQISEITFERGDFGVISSKLYKRISSLIATSTTIQSLTFEADELCGDKRFEPLATALMSNKSCQQLNLAHNTLDDDHISSLLTLIKRNQLKELNLLGSNFSDDGLHEIFTEVKTIFESIKNRGEKINLKTLNLGEDDDLTYNSIETQKTMDALIALKVEQPFLRITVNDYLYNKKIGEKRKLDTITYDTKDNINKDEDELFLEPCTKKLKNEATDQSVNVNSASESSSATSTLNSSSSSAFFKFAPPSLPPPSDTSEKNVSANNIVMVKK